jgi:HAMP domain-containing protein
MDVVYLIAGLVVPTATVLGLRLWRVRSRADVRARALADLNNSELAKTVAAVQERLTELSGQIETMNQDWEERDNRLTGQLNALLALTERPRRLDLSVGDRPSVRRSSRP